MSSLHEQFVIEARELIQQATDDLIAMERDGVTSARIDRVFRAFHTLKGSAGVMALPAMTLALHAAEDLIAAIAAGKLADTAAIDAALACLDKISVWVDDLDVLRVTAVECRRRRAADRGAASVPPGSAAFEGGSTGRRERR